MLSGITIGQYFPGNSLVHRMDPRVKLVLTFAYIIAVFIPRNWVGLAAAVAFLILSVALSRLPVKLIWKSIKPILPLILFTSIINIFFVSGDPLSALSSSHVSDIVVQMGGNFFRAAPNVGTLENQAGQGSSPPYGVSRPPF